MAIIYTHLYSKYATKPILSTYIQWQNELGSQAQVHSTRIEMKVSKKLKIIKVQYTKTCVHSQNTYTRKLIPASFKLRESFSSIRTWFTAEAR
jgi:hypothetical protein